MRTTLFAVSVVTTLAGTAVSAQDAEIISIDDGSLIVCRSLSAAQTMYALVVNDRMQNVSGCWVVDAPMEVTVLQDGPRISSITYREFTDETEIARMVARGIPEVMVDRARSNPWSAWYQRPAWAFSAWLEQGA